jgi:hypothetical protein
MRAAIGIIFDTLYYCINTILVALEVDNPVVLLVATTDMTSRDPSSIVTSARFGFLFQ